MSHTVIYFVKPASRWSGNAEKLFIFSSPNDQDWEAIIEAINLLKTDYECENFIYDEGESNNHSVLINGLLFNITTQYIDEVCQIYQTPWEL